MARGKELKVIASVPHTCPKCRGKELDPPCKTCGGVGRWHIQMFESPPPAPRPMGPRDHIQDGVNAFALKQTRRL